ncbi:MAG TPA: hypothetical protein VGO50_04970 [Pyrinomonadaceae bacterium]|jgi:hypothetical protein|nr:hypothetical protein [Pyrinomonadaceae bacterium]
MKFGTILAAVAGGLVMFLLGFLFFGILLANFFAEYTVKYQGLMKDPPEISLIFLFNLVWAWLIAFVMEWSGISTITGGVKAGAAIMFALILGVNLQYYAFMNLHTSIVPLVVDVLVVTVMGAVAGAVIALVLGFFNKPKEAAE